MIKQSKVYSLYLLSPASSDGAQGIFCCSSTRKVDMSSKTANSLRRYGARKWQLPNRRAVAAQRIGNCQKLAAICSKELAVAKSPPQSAAKNWQLPKARRNLQQRIGSCQKPAAICSKELAAAKSPPQSAAKNWQQASRKTEQVLGSPRIA